jgi:hypothetical protein
MNPGRPAMTGAPAPTQAAPKVPRPQQPAVPSKPIGRPVGAVAKPSTPAPGAAGTTSWSRTVSQPAQTGWRTAIAGAPAAGIMSPDQRARAAAVRASPGDASRAASTKHFEAIQPQAVAKPGGPATTPAPNAPAPAGPAAGPPQQAAAPIATPETAASRPLKDSPWAYEKKWGALGDIGDAELDAALKGAVMNGLNGTEFTAEKEAIAQGQNFDQGMAGLKSQRSAIEADMARRGLSNTGVAAELGAEAETAARGQIADQQRATMMEFSKLRSEEKQAAISAAQNLAQQFAQKGIDLENLRMQREQLAIQSKRGGGGGGDDNMIEIDNGDGTTSQVDLRLVDLMLNMGEGGMW